MKPAKYKHARVHPAPYLTHNEEYVRDMARIIRQYHEPEDSPLWNKEDAMIELGLLTALVVFAEIAENCL